MKSGIDYFPLDVTLDEKFEMIEAPFGLKGFAIMIKLLQKIYGGEGYYAEWTTEIALLFAKRIGANGSAVSDIVSAAIKRGIFDKTLYDKYQILTSKGIQKRYFEIVSRRKNVEVKREYLLFDAAILRKNADNLAENVDIFPKNAYISEQSKGKESKGKKRKVEESRGENPPSPPTDCNIRLREFLGKHKNVIVDNCSGVNLDMIDYDLLEYRFAESSYLSDRVHELSWIAKNYVRISAGEFKDRTLKSKSGITEKVQRVLQMVKEEEENEVGEN